MSTPARAEAHTPVFKIIEPKPMPKTIIHTDLSGPGFTMAGNKKFWDELTIQAQKTPALQSIIEINDANNLFALMVPEDQINDFAEFCSERGMDNTSALSSVIRPIWLAYEKACQVLAPDFYEMVNNSPDHPLHADMKLVPWERGRHD